ncbi:MAG: class I SAM-dependent methyltransferase [Deltaproteobacteria bacterium]|nr:class I SAM-dependent methyltransferase [Deltaproteobacteria bacterium]
MKDKYSIIGPLYDFLAMVYSANQIDHCKTAMHDRIRPDNSVLFAGVGHGIDALAAAERGAKVTVVDLSDTMLKKFNRKMKDREFRHPIRQVHQDILKFSELNQYDMVFANFFLNVFPEEKMVEILSHLVELAKRRGFVIVGDFSLPEGGPVRRVFQVIYWRIADLVFWMTAGNALHPVYDYAFHMKQLGLKIKTVRYFRFLFDNRYYSILGQKK